jgi:hypothetical protein
MSLTWRDLKRQEAKDIAEDLDYGIKDEQACFVLQAARRSFLSFAGAACICY